MMNQSTATPILRVGSSDATTNNAVSRLVNFLIQNGYPIQGITRAVTPGKAIFGPKVQSAVMKFQKDAGIKADGIVGPATWALIQSIESPVKMDTTTIEAAPTIKMPETAPPQEEKKPAPEPEQSIFDTKWFWPLVGGSVIAAGIFGGLIIAAVRRKR